MKNQNYTYLVSGTAPWCYPVDTMFALLYYDADNAIEIPKRYPYQGEWGQPLSMLLLEQTQYPIPYLLDMVWLSIVERKFYSLTKRLPVDILENLFARRDNNTNQAVFNYIIAGMAPYGKVAVWIHGPNKAVLVAWEKAEQIEVSMKDFMPMNPNVTLDENCDFYINNDAEVEKNLTKNGLPPCDLYDKYMQQFIYRYLPIYEKYDADRNKWAKYKEDEPTPEFDYIEEALFDGTHDKLHDDGLLKYHEAGKPKKLAAKWHIRKSEYTAYFWFEDEKICALYDKFYGAHPDTKSDFIIRIDAEQKKYELSLFRYGMKEPQIIPETTYQLLVFKNGFEDYRSGNYNQKRGAWIW